MEKIDHFRLINKVTNFIEYLYNRLKTETSGLSCIEVLRHHRRIEILRKHVERLVNEEIKLRYEYQRINKAIKKYYLYTKRLTKIAISLIIFISLIMSFTVIENIYHLRILPPELENIFGNPELFPIIMTSGGSIIAFLVITVTFIWIQVSKKYNINQLKKRELEIRKKYHWDVNKRLNILKRELERSTTITSSVKTIQICKCYEEFTMLYNMLKNLATNLVFLRRCRNPECKEKALDNIVKQLRGLKELHEVCNSIFTREYYVSIEFNELFPNNIRSLEDILGTEEKFTVKIKIRDMEYEIDLNGLIRYLLLTSS